MNSDDIRDLLDDGEKFYIVAPGVSAALNESDALRPLRGRVDITAPGVVVVADDAGDEHVYLSRRAWRTIEAQ